MKPKMDQLGFVIGLSGQVDFFGKRVEKQSTLDQSISHMQSFRRDIGEKLIFKMLSIPLDSYSSILDVMDAMVKKNFVAFSNMNTYAVNGQMCGFLYLPEYYTEKQRESLILLAPLLAGFTHLSVYKYQSGKKVFSSEVDQKQLEDEREIANCLDRCLRYCPETASLETSSPFRKH